MNAAHTTNQNPVRVVVVDDNPSIRDVFRMILSATENVQIASEGRDGDEAVELAVSLNPDVVIMDIAMPNVNGLDATRRIKNSGAESGVVICSNYMDRHLVIDACDAGAAGYIMKSNAAEELPPAIRAVAAGKSYFGAEVFDVRRPRNPDITD